MRSRFATRVGVIVMAAALVAACGADDPSEPRGSATDAGEPQSGGTAAIIQTSEPRALDPALMSNSGPTNPLVGNSLYGQLLTVGPEGEIGYGIAESLTTSDEGTTWRLEVREGVTFSDGTPLDAAAVQANWERLRDPEVGSAAITFAGYLDTMSADGLVLEFTLTRPVAAYQNAIADAMNWIAEPGALAAGPQAFDANPIGAGPFVLESWTRNGEMVLTRNDSYWDAPRPYLDELVLTANPDGPQRLSTVLAGGADAMFAGEGDLLAQATAEGLAAAPQELGGGIMLGMNTRLAPFDDVRARRAVAQGVDREAINAATYQGQGVVPATLYTDDAPYNGATTLPEHDPEAAQELFDELAAEGRPVEFTISSHQTTQSRRTAESVQAQLNQYDNVRVEIEVLDFAAAAAEVAQRSFQMTGVAINFVEPALSLYTTLHSTARGNSTGISDPALDAALETALGATDPDERVEAYEEVGRLFTELTPALTYVRSSWAVIHTDRVHGVQMYGLGAIRTDGIWVSD